MHIQDFLKLKKQKEYIFIKDGWFIFPDKKRKKGKLINTKEKDGQDFVSMEQEIIFQEFEENQDFAKGYFYCKLENGETRKLIIFNSCFYKKN